MNETPGTLGFVGTGHIASCVVTGLLTSETPPDAIVLSPRNARVAEELADRFPQVSIAVDNQAVLEASSAVFLSVRPQIAAEVIPPLTFHDGQLVISLMALIPLAQLRAWVAPARTVVRALPLPPIARQLGATVLTPDEPRARALFASSGTAVPVDDEAAFDRLGTLTALAAPYYELLQVCGRWASERGVPQAAAGRYLAALFHGLAAESLDVDDGDFSALVNGLATPETINLQALSAIRAEGGFSAFDTALSQVLARVESGGD